jgi:hypothetical protein
MTRNTLLVAVMFVGLVITGFVVSPIKASLSSPTTSEASIPQNFNFADKVSVSIEKHVEITQNFSLVDTWTGSITALPMAGGPPSGVDEIINQFLEKITSYGPAFWNGNPLVRTPDWPWIPAGIVAILGIVGIGRRAIIIRLPNACL